MEWAQEAEPEHAEPEQLETERAQPHIRAETIKPTDRGRNDGTGETERAQEKHRSTEHYGQEIIIIIKHRNT